MDGEQLLERLRKATEQEPNGEVARAFMRILDRVQDTIDEENSDEKKPTQS